MSVFTLRILSRLVGFALLLVLAVGGLAVAVFCIGGGDATLGLANLASLLSLDRLRDTVGPWLESLEADGALAATAALCGLGAVALGIGLLVGALVPRRERLLVIRRADRGDVTARRRAVASALSDLAERPREILGAKAKVRPHRRRAGGRARIKLVRGVGTDERAAAAESRRALSDLGEAMSLKLRSVSHRRRHGGRAL